MDKTKLLIIVIVSLFGLAIIGNVFQYCQKPKVVSIKETIDTAKIKNQFKAELETKLKAELKPIIKIKKVPSTIDLDSLRIVIDQYWLDYINEMQSDTITNHNILGQYNYTANADTTIKKGNDTLVAIGVKYSSRIPLDPQGEVSINALWYDHQITHTTETIIEEQKTFWQRLFGGLNYSVGVYFGQGLINKQFDMYLGVGISYNIKSVF